MTLHLNDNYNLLDMAGIKPLPKLIFYPICWELFGNILEAKRDPKSQRFEVAEWDWRIGSDPIC